MKKSLKPQSYQHNPAHKTEQTSYFCLNEWHQTTRNISEKVDLQQHAAENEKQNISFEDRKKNAVRNPEKIKWVGKI